MGIFQGALSSAVVIFMGCTSVIALLVLEAPKYPVSWLSRVNRCVGLRRTYGAIDAASTPRGRV